MIQCLPQLPWSGPQRFLHRLVPRRFRLGFGLLFLMQPLQGWGAGADPENFFETKIRPLLSQACYDCHSESRKKSKGGLFQPISRPSRWVAWAISKTWMDWGEKPAWSGLTCNRESPPDYLKATATRAWWKACNTTLQSLT